MDELLHKSLDKGYNCSDQIKSLVVYLPTTNNPDQKCVHVECLVDQSYGTTTEATEKDQPHYKVGAAALQLLCACQGLRRV